MKPSILDRHGANIALYERPGSNPTLFFIHGNSSDAHAFESVWSCAALQNFHLIAIDLPGHGESAFADDESLYTFDSLGRLISDVICEKKLNDVILNGHSIGGHIALNALKFTPHVIGISLSGTAPINGVEDLANAYHITDAVQTVFRGDATESEIITFSKQAVHKGNHYQDVADRFRATDKNFRRVVGLELGRHFGAEDFQSELDLLRGKGVSVCLIHGEEENMVNISYLESLQGLNLFRGKVHVVSRAGHSVPFESPEEYARIIAEFASHHGVRMNKI